MTRCFVAGMCKGGGEPEPSDLSELTILMIAVVLLVVQGFVINRLAGIPYPLWSPRPPDT